MSATVRSETGVSTFGTNLAVAETDASPAGGDLRIVFLTIAGSVTISVPTGWTTVVNGAFGSYTMAIATKPWVVGVGSQTFSWVTNCYYNVEIVSVTGWKTAATVTTTTNSGSGTALTGSGLTPASGDELLFGYFNLGVASGGPTTTLSDPTGMTRVGAHAPTTAAGMVGLLDTVPVAGATGTKSSTASQSGAWRTALVSIPSAPTVTVTDAAGRPAEGGGSSDTTVAALPVPVTVADPAGQPAEDGGVGEQVGVTTFDQSSSSGEAVGTVDLPAAGHAEQFGGAEAGAATGGVPVTEMERLGGAEGAKAPADTPIGSVSGPLVSPILRVLADFTQGPPGQPASTAGGTTVELTQQMAATNVTIRRGRQYELGKPQAGTAAITFSDPGELLNPTNTSSPYNSGSASLVSYRPMRITAVWKSVLYTIYTGYIERYPQTWTDAGFRGIKPLECVDGLAMLANTTVHQSYFETIMADNPAIYIPYNESAAPANVYLTSSKALLANGASLPGNPRQGTSNYYQTQLLVGGTALRVVPSASNGGQVSFGGDTMPDGTPALTLSSKLAAPGGTDTSRQTARVDTAGGTFSLNTAGSTIECWFRWTAGSVSVMVCESVTDGEFDYGTVDSFVGLYFTQTGRLGFSISTGAAYVWDDVSPYFTTYTGYPDGQWHYAAMTFSVNSSNHVSVTCTFDFAETSYDSGYTPAQLGINSVHSHATSEFGDPASQVSIAQFAYYPTPLTRTQRINHANRGFGYNGDTPYGRFYRLVQQYWGGSQALAVTPDIRPYLDTDFVYGVYPVPGNDAQQAAQIQPYTVQQALQMVDTATQGMSYFNASGVATHEPRNYRIGSTASLATFGDRPGELPYTALEYDFDPTYVYTQTQVTKSQGGQVITNDNLPAEANYGVRTYSDTIQLREEFDLFQFGMHILAMYGSQRVRIRRMEIDPAAAGNDTLWQIVLGLELSQRFTVKRRTADGTTFSHDYFVEQIEHQIDPAASTWKVMLQLSPVLYPTAPGVVGATGSTGTLGVGTVVTY